MKSQVEYRSYRRKFCRPLKTAHGEWQEREGFIIRVETDGAPGYGEIAPIPDFGTETLERAAGFLEKWVSDPIIMPSGLPCSSFALTSAVHQSRQTESVSPRNYAVAGLLPEGEGALEAAKRKISNGYRCLKWKIGVLPVELENEIFKELQALLPENVQLRLDANGALDEAGMEGWVSLLAEFSKRVEYLEQPMPPGSERQMAKLAEGSGVPIALDESLNKPGRDQWLFPNAWKGPLVIKPSLMGNITTLLEQLKPIAGQVVLSSAFETGVGLFHALSIADMLPEMNYAIGFDTLDAFDDSLSGLSARPMIKVGDRAEIDLDAIWKHLPHSN